jgi:hypothetical protein
MSANDGGPAFPVPVAPYGNDLRASDEPGMSLRDFFAAHAIAIVARQADLDNAGTPELAAACFEFADQLLEERETPLLESTSQQLRADLADDRASRYEVLLRAVCAACDKGDVGQTDELRAALAAANKQLADDEVPF